MKMGSLGYSTTRQMTPTDNIKQTKEAPATTTNEDVVTNNLTTIQRFHRLIWTLVAQTDQNVVVLLGDLFGSIDNIRIDAMRDFDEHGETMITSLLDRFGSHPHMRELIRLFTSNGSILETPNAAGASALSIAFCNPEVADSVADYVARNGSWTTDDLLDLYNGALERTSPKGVILSTYLAERGFEFIDSKEVQKIRETVVEQDEKIKELEASKLLAEAAATAAKHAAERKEKETADIVQKLAAEMDARLKAEQAKVEAEQAKTAAVEKLRQFTQILAANFTNDTWAMGTDSAILNAIISNKKVETLSTKVEIPVNKTDIELKPMINVPPNITDIKKAAMPCTCASCTK